LQDRTHRRFTLLDAMILVAGTALGLGLTRSLSSERLLLPFDPIGPLSSRWGSSWTGRDWSSWAVETVLYRFYYLMPLLFSLTVTLTVLRLRPPRLRLARLMRLPSVVAGVTAISVLVLSLPLMALWQGSTLPVQFILAQTVACAVGSAWLVLLFGGRWRGDSGWIDRLGRLLGAAWIAPISLIILRGLL
jgi:hypothetical protein